MKKFVFKNYFIIILIIIYFLSDFILVSQNPIGKSDYFDKNDIERSQVANPEKEWDKVFYGSSVVAASYIEGDGGYVNLGIDYGTIKDIEKLLRNGTIKVESELVLGLNDIAFYDELPTNKTYMNHKKPFEHYIYFNRDRINNFLLLAYKRFLNKEAVFVPEYKNQGKELYFGSLSEEELDKNNDRMIELFSFSMDSCKENFAALEDLIAFTSQNNINVTALWMPLNTKFEKTPTILQVMSTANEILGSHDIKILDWTEKLSPEYFHDTGHLNYELGAPYFTEEVNNELGN